MYYAIYKTTNLVNNKIYIGMHRTDDLNDDYLGSGKWLKRAIKKYGRDSFKREILFVFDNEDDMKSKELEIVNEDFCLRDDTYNLNVGGLGSWDYVNRTCHTNKGNHRKTGNYGWKVKGILTEKERQRRSDFMSQVNKTSGNPFRGKSHSEETKRRISNKMKLKQSGLSNSQFGTCWITKDSDTRKVPKLDLDLWLKMGYHRGRI